MVARMVGLGLLWLLLWRVSALMEYAPHASIWFPPSALTLAAFLVLGRRAVPVIAVCGLIVTFWADLVYQSHMPWMQTLTSGVLFVLAHAGTFFLGAMALRWLDGRAITLPARVIGFLLIASVSALAAAILGVQALLLAGTLGPAESDGLWVPWWIGDMAAAVALCPLFAGLLGHVFSVHRRAFPVLELSVSRLPRRPGALQSFPGKLGVLLVPLLLVMLLSAISDHGELLAFAVFYLIIPQMWITYTESALRVAVSLALFSTVMALCVGLLDLPEQAMVYQFAITVIAASTWFGLSVPTLVAQNRRLRELAEADELTGVTSRRHFFERAREELAQARHNHAPAALLIFDIDRFKQINDRFGHTRGDSVLVEVARAIQGHLRRGDLFGRFGGDEFMLFISGCTAAQARERAEALRRALHGIRLEGIEAPLSGTFSVVGILPTETVTEAFERADAGLLVAKRAGRDRVACTAD